MITRIEFDWRSHHRDEYGNPDERWADLWRHWSVTQDIEDCPHWREQADNFLDDPITVEAGVGYEMLPLLRSRHREKCQWCENERKYWTLLWNIGFHLLISDDPVYRQ